MSDGMTFRKNDLTICLNYSSVENSREDAIFIENIDIGGDEQDLTITIDEAKWMIETLGKFVDKFENLPKFKLYSVINKLEGEEATSFSEIAGKLKEIVRGM